MAEQNPIKYSDLISPDDSIEKLISQLESLQETYKGVADSVKANAAAMKASLQSVSGATEAGRASTRGASQEADRLTKAYKDLAFARSETARQIAELKQQQKEEQMITKLNVQLNNSAEGSYNRLSAQYRLNKIALNNLTAEERQNLPHAKKLEEETKAIYDEMKRLQEATGKFSLNVGNYTGSIEQAIGVNSKWYQGLQQLAGLFQGGFKAGVSQAGSAVAGFGKQLLALLANPIVATIAAITAAFMALAKGISSSEENTNTLMRIMAPFQRILTGVVDVLQTMAGWLLKAVEGFESLAMGASRLMERLPLVGSAFKKVNDELQKNVNLERERQQLTRDGRNLTKQEAKTQYEIAVLRRKANQTDDPKLRVAYLQKAVAKERQISQNRVAFLQRELKVMKEKAAQSQNDAATNDAIAQKEAEIWNARAQAEQRSLRMIRQISTAQNQMNRPTGGGGKVSNAADQARREAAEQERIRKDAEKKELAAIRQSEDAKVALMENEYDRERAAVTLSYDRQIEDIRTRLATEENLTVAAKEALNETIIDLEQQKWNKLADISDKEMKAALDAEQRDYEARIKATDNLIREQQEKRKKNPDMYDLLGFNLSDEKKEAINTSLQFAMDSLNQYMEAYVAAAEKKAELAGQEVDRAQRTLQMEMEARNAGYANNVEQARKELALARQTEQKALEDQKRAQKQQMAIQALQQVESLITASAKIWGQLGFPWAIPAIAVMFASFAASKVMAANAVGAGTEKYGEGTVELLEGGSHQSGNDIDLGRKKDGTRRRAEGGEYFAVINKRNSRKYGDIIPDVINSLNNGTFAEKYMRSYDGGGVVVNMGGGHTDLRELTDSVNDIREQGRRRTYTDGRGNEIEIYKNLKRTTYKDAN